MRQPRALSACILAVGVWFLVSCATNAPTQPPPPVPECSGPVTVFVTGDSIPTFSWEPTCKLGRLLVKEIAEERWGTETLGFNDWVPPIQYGVHPPGSENVEPGAPLYTGTTYTVEVYRWVDPTDLDTGFELIGSQDFTY